MATKVLKDIDNNSIDISPVNLETFKSTVCDETYVPKTATVAGIPMTSDIPAEALQSALPKDSALDITSENAVKNKTISEYVMGIEYTPKGEIANGSLQINGQTYSNGVSITIPVEVGDEYLITGRHINDFIPLYLFLDANDSIITPTFTGTNNTPYTDYKLIIPTNAVKLVVNGVIQSRPSVDNPTCGRIYIRQPNLIQLQNQKLLELMGRKQDKIYEWSEMELTTVPKIAGGSGSKTNYANGGISTVIDYNPNNNYKFTGMCISGDYPVLVFTDENDWIMGTWNYTQYQLASDVEVTIPYGTKKIYVNSNNASNLKVKVEAEVPATEKQDVLVSGENIKTVGGKNILGSGNLPIDLSALSPDVIAEIDDKISSSELTETIYTPFDLKILSESYITNGTMYGNGCRVEMSVNEGDVYYITGRHINDSIPLYLFFNGDTITSPYRGTGGDYKNMELTVPANVTKLVVQGYITGGRHVRPIISTKSTVTDTLSAMSGRITTKKETEFEYVRIGTRVNGYVAIASSRMTFTESGGYHYTVFDYDKTKKYKVSFICRTTSVPALCFADENDVVTGPSAYGSQADVGVPVMDLDLDPSIVPEGTKKIYVNGFHSSGDDVGGYAKVGVERKIASRDAGKKGVFFGDSVTYGTKISLTPYLPPYNDYPDVVGRMLGITVYNAALGGSACSGNRGIDFPAIADAVVSGDFTDVYADIDSILHDEASNIKKRYDVIKELDFSKIDFIVINYGTNDFNFGRTLATLKEAFMTNVGNIMQAYPNLKVYVLTSIYGNGYGENAESCDTYVNGQGLKLRDYVDTVLEAAKEMHLPSKDLLAGCCINAQNYGRYLSADKTHPNVEGHARLAEIVAKFIESN